MNPMINFAMNMIRNNPQIVNNPMAQNMLNVLQSGDSRTGEQIANNLCQTYGISREDAIKQAQQFFGMR